MGVMDRPPARSPPQRADPDARALNARPCAVARRLLCSAPSQVTTPPAQPQPMPTLRLARALLTPALAATLAATALACGGDAGDRGIGPPSAGAFGRGNVAPECGALSQACLTGGLNAPIATGAKLGLGVDTQLAGSGAPPTTLESVNPDIALVEGGVLTAFQPGMVGLLMNGPGGAVTDFIHVFIADPDDLRLIRFNDAGVPLGAVRDDATLLVGDEIYVVVEAFADSQPLLGLFKTTWTVDVTEGDPSQPPLIVVDDLVFGWFRIVARAPGAVTLRADALGITKTLNIEVLP